MTWIGHLDIFVLAVMLAYVFGVVVRLSFRWRSALQLKPIVPTDATLHRDLKKLTANLSIHAENLKSIVSTAPFLGLVGTCLGIVSAFPGYSGSPARYVVIVACGMAAALMTTAAGLLVAIPATCAYNYVRSCIASLQSDVPSKPLEQGVKPFQGAQTLPLAERFSQPPAYALISVPALAIAIAALMMFVSFQIPVGFVIEVPTPSCDASHRLVVLHLAHSGQLFIDFEPVDQSTLANRLSQIYSTRAERKLYLLVDDDVPFQSAAEVLNIVRNTSDTTFVSKSTFFSQPKKVNLNISVSLVTPALAKASCLTPILMR